MVKCEQTNFYKGEKYEIKKSVAIFISAMSLTGASTVVTAQSAQEIILETEEVKEYEDSEAAVEIQEQPELQEVESSEPFQTESENSKERISEGLTLKNSKAIPDNSTTGLQDVKEGEFQYSLNAETQEARITKYIGSSTKIITQARVIYGGNNYQVTAIGNGAFVTQNNKIQEEVVSEGVSQIEDSAFYSWGAEEGSLISVTLSSTLKEIGVSAFESQSK